MNQATTEHCQKPVQGRRGATICVSLCNGALVKQPAAAVIFGGTMGLISESRRGKPVLA